MSPSDDWREVAATWATDSRHVLLDRIALIPLVIAPQRLGPPRSHQPGHRRRAGAHRPRPRSAAVVVRVVGRYFAGAVLLDAPRVRTGGVDPAPLDRTFAIGLSSALLSGLGPEVAV